METKEIEINVTENDIKLGKSRSCDFCPIARAIKRRIKKGICVQVYFSLHCNRKFICDMPDTASYFVRSFDDGYPVSPFRFKIEIPKEYLK